MDSFDSRHSLFLRFLLEGIAAGTFVYVACVEMLAAEISHAHGERNFLKALAVTAGVLVFYVLQQKFSHAH